MGCGVRDRISVCPLCLIVGSSDGNRVGSILTDSPGDLNTVTFISVIPLVVGIESVLEFVGISVGCGIYVSLISCHIVAHAVYGDCVFTAVINEAAYNVSARILVHYLRLSYRLRCNCEGKNCCFRLAFKVACPSVVSCVIKLQGDRADFACISCAYSISCNLGIEVAGSAGSVNSATCINGTVCKARLINGRFFNDVIEDGACTICPFNAILMLFLDSDLDGVTACLYVTCVRVRVILAIAFSNESGLLSYAIRKYEVILSCGKIKLEGRRCDSSNCDYEIYGSSFDIIVVIAVCGNVCYYLIFACLCNACSRYVFAFAILHEVLVLYLTVARACNTNGCVRSIIISPVRDSKRGVSFCIYEAVLYLCDFVFDGYCVTINSCVFRKIICVPLVVLVSFFCELDSYGVLTYVDSTNVSYSNERFIEVKSYSRLLILCHFHIRHVIYSGNVFVCLSDGYRYAFLGCRVILVIKLEYYYVFSCVINLAEGSLFAIEVNLNAVNLNAAGICLSSDKTEVVTIIVILAADTKTVCYSDGCGSGSNSEWYGYLKCRCTLIGRSKSNKVIIYVQDSGKIITLANFDPLGYGIIVKLIFNAYVTVKNGRSCNGRCAVNHFSIN